MKKIFSELPQTFVLKSSNPTPVRATMLPISLREVTFQQSRLRAVQIPRAETLQLSGSGKMERNWSMSFMSKR